jgi:hypothetical protein
MERVELGPDAVTLYLDSAVLLRWMDASLAHNQIESNPSAIILTIPVRLKRRGVELKLVASRRSDATAA